MAEGAEEAEASVAVVEVDISEEEGAEWIKDSEEETSAAAEDLAMGQISTSAAAAAVPVAVVVTLVARGLRAPR